VVRVHPGANDALLTAAAQYATGNPTDQATALTWLVNDTNNGTRYGYGGRGISLFTIDAFVNSSIGWAYTNAALCNTAGYPASLKFIIYEGGWSTFPITAIGGAVMGLTTTQVQQVRDLWNAFKLADTPGLGQAMDQINTAFSAMPFCSIRYYGQYEDITSKPWAITPSPALGLGSVNNYGPGVSYGSFTAISRWNH
jgi:hypothetical protein